MSKLTVAINESIDYLASAGALSSIERDPYWPKWDSPWWHMLLLFEMELTHKIPAVAIWKMVKTLKTHYLPVFPIIESEFPADSDPYKDIACLCAVGSIYQVLYDYGVNVDSELPWMRPWFLQYQLPDGGLNCDEAAYTKEKPKSSIVSTLPCLEAILFCRQGELDQKEVAFLNKGASYLLKHQLFRKVSNGEVIDKNWLEIKFPRFYDYDYLRGFYFLVKWRELSGFDIPDGLACEVSDLVATQWRNEKIVLKRYNFFDNRSYIPNENGEWTWGEASGFTLMKVVSFRGADCLPLTKKWNEIKPQKVKVIKDYTVVYTRPIKLKVGQKVEVLKHENKTEWRGWVYIETNQGTKGWVSKRYIKEDESVAMVISNYDATELAVNKDDELTVLHTEFGWCWSQNTAGLKGWVPEQNLHSL